MTPVLPPTVAAAALADPKAAVDEYEDAIAWFAGRVDSYRMPIAVEVWVLDPTLTRVLLVEHRWRGWVPPGGKAGRGEMPREAAARELLEETGLSVDLLPRTAAAMVRAYHPDWPHALGLTYAAIADPAAPLVAEPGNRSRGRRSTSRARAASRTTSTGSEATWPGRSDRPEPVPPIAG